MSEFRSEISSRIDRVKGDLARGAADGDDYLVAVSLGELESLARIAVEHDVPVDGVDEAVAAAYSSRSAPSLSSSAASTSTSGARAATSSSPDGGPPLGPRTSTPLSVATSQAAAKSQGLSPRS